jgi:cell division protein FtsL
MTQIEGSGVKKLKRINKALLVGFVALFVIFTTWAAWNNLKPYTINEW